MTDIVEYDQPNELATSTLFGTDNPAEVVERAAKVAKTLEQLVRQQKLIVKIGQSEHVRVEGWTLLGSMLGVFPVVEWTRPVTVNDEILGWEARVEARTRTGQVVGAAESECLRSERTWSNRDEYALRSMAQTRAVSKALRLPLGFVMQLAGFNPTPAEEMPMPDRGSSASTDPAEGTPFSDGWEDHPPDFNPSTPVTLATKLQKKKLDVLVGNLRETSNGRVTTERLWESLARGRGADMEALIRRNHGRDGDGVLHWSPMREVLTKAEAHALIEKLSAVEAELAT